MLGRLPEEVRRPRADVPHRGGNTPASAISSICRARGRAPPGPSTAEILEDIRARPNLTSRILDAIGARPSSRSSRPRPKRLCGSAPRAGHPEVTERALGSRRGAPDRDGAQTVRGSRSRAAFSLMSGSLRIGARPPRRTRVAVRAGSALRALDAIHLERTALAPQGRLAGVRELRPAASSESREALGLPVASPR